MQCLWCYRVSDIESKRFVSSRLVFFFLGRVLFFLGEFFFLFWGGEGPFFGRGRRSFLGERRGRGNFFLVRGGEEEGSFFFLERGFLLLEREVLFFWE